MNSVIVLVVLAGFFDSPPIYQEPLANVRSPDVGMTVNTSKYLGSRIWYLEGSLGKTIPVVTESYGKLQSQLSLQAGSWLVLGYENMRFPMLTQDFFFAFPLSFRYNDFSMCVKYNHISSHQGDGYNAFLEDNLSPKEKKELEYYERIASKRGIDLTLEAPIVYSRDFVSFHVSYDYRIHSARARSYAHIGYVHKMVPSYLKRWFVGQGTEIIKKISWVPLYYAQDITYNQDMSSWDYSGELGIISKNSQARLAFTLYLGSDRRGQMLGRRLQQLGLGFFIR